MSHGILETFYPEIFYSLNTASYPEGKNFNSTLAHSFVPSEQVPSKQVVMIFRHPLDRFLSACTFLGLTDVEKTINSLHGTALVTGKNKKIFRACDDIHFRKQHLLIRENAKLFKFQGINKAAEFIGLKVPLPWVNISKQQKPELSDEQKYRLLKFYSDDFDIFKGIS